MTGTGFDGLVVDHGGLDEITDTLTAMVKAVDDRMDRLESDLAPLRSDWSGHAQQAYHRAKTTWDAAIAEMVQLLADTGTTVSTSNGEYRAADLRGADSFGIGRA